MQKLNGIYSLGKADSCIYTPHFRGFASTEQKIDPRPVPYIFERPTLGFINPASYTPPNAKLRALDMGISYRIKQGQAELKTSQGRFRFQLPDIKYQVNYWEDASPIFDRWKAAGEKDQTIQYAPKPQTESRLVATQEYKARFIGGTQLNKYVTHTAYEGHGNNLGRELSARHNFVANIRRLMFDYTNRNTFTKDIESFAGSLKEKWGPAKREIVGVGTQKTSGKWLAAIEVDDPFAVLYSNSDFQKFIRAKAEHYGLEGFHGRDAVAMATILHELTHFHQPSELLKDYNNAEKDVARSLYDFFAKKAAEYRGTPKEAVYKALMRAENDYYQYYENLENMPKSRFKNAESGADKKSLEAKVKGKKATANKPINTLDDVVDSEKESRQKTSSGTEIYNSNRSFNSEQGEQKEEVEDTDDSPEDKEAV